MKRNNRNILIIGAALLILLIGTMLGTPAGKNFLSGAAGGPGELAVLSLSASDPTPACGAIRFPISVANSSHNNKAEGVVVTMRVVEGANYISESASSMFSQRYVATWEPGNVGTGEGKSTSITLNTTEAWKSAPAGAKVTVLVTIMQENTNPGENVGKTATATLMHPTSCNTQQDNPSNPPNPSPGAANNSGGGNPEPTLTPTPENKVCSPWIIIHSQRAGNLDIFRLDGREPQAGYKLYNLSGSAAADSNPSRSPDSLWVAFQSERDGNAEIYLTDGAGERQIRLTELASTEINPIFGPDNRSIVYQSNRAGNWNIYLYDRLNKQEKQLTSGTKDETNPSWSANGLWVAYQTNAKGNWDIEMVNVRTGEVVSLVATADDEIAPVWSPDGQRIAFISAGNDIYLVNQNGTNLVKVNSNGSASAPAWSPDGRRLAYQQETDGNMDIYVYAISNKQTLRLTNAAGIEAAPSWDCSGKIIYFTSGEGDAADIYQVSATSGVPAQVTNDPSADFAPVANNPRASGGLP